MNTHSDTNKRLILDAEHIAPDGPELSKGAFAELFLARLRGTSSKHEWVYDRDRFVVRTAKGDRGAWLWRLYEAYAAGADGWEGALVNMIASLQSDTSDFFKVDNLDEAKESLVPQIYHRAELCKPEVDPSKWQSHLPIGDHLAVGLVRDFETGFVPVNAEILHEWNIDSEEAMSVAMKNLRTQHSRPGIRIGDGTYKWEFDGDLNPANILITEQIARLKLKGDPVALPYGRNCLIVTGSDDEDGLSELIAATTVPTFRHITDTPIICTQGTWQTWVPDSESALGIRLRELRAEETAAWYLHRKRPFEELGLHFPTVKVLGHERLGSAVTCCVWQINLPSPLPQTEFVHVLDMDYTLGTIAFFRAGVPWIRLAPLVQELFQLAPGYPPVWMPTRPATADEKAQIRQIADQYGFKELR